MHITAVPTYSSFLAELSQRADVSGLASPPDFHKKSLKLYMNSARLLFRTAELYRRTGDLPNAYVLYLKYSNLLVYVFPKHRQYPQYQQLQDMQELKRNAVLAMDALEELKEGLEQWWEQHVKPVITRQSDDNERTVIEDSTDLIVDNRIQEPEYAPDQREDDLIAAERRKSEVEKFYREQFKASVSGPTMSNGPPIEATSERRMSVFSDQTKILDERKSSIQSTQSQQPLKPEKPTVKVEQVFLTEAGMPLRTVKVPFALIDVFMRIASANTSKNIETCGVLGGTLMASTNAFTITHLIVPKQHGTSDTCVMVNEEEVAEAAISNSLMTLGWIHTHPTQSCFMSSVDQHTQFPFQALMAEAIAVVLAPRKTPNFGVFRLTDPPGIPFISHCSQSGFHAHPDNMYCELVHTQRGHVKMDPSASLTVIDLR